MLLVIMQKVKFLALESDLAMWAFQDHSTECTIPSNKNPFFFL